MMQLLAIQALFFVLAAALLGGVAARLLRLRPIVGYIIAGVVFGSFLVEKAAVESLVEIGIILLLFSVGLELSFSKLARVYKVATFGAIAQIVIISGLSFAFLSALKFPPLTSLVLSLGFSLSSTAIVVKILDVRGERDTIHGGVMVGWLLVQDLAVIPMMVILPVLAQANGGGWFVSGGRALVVAVLIVGAIILLGRIVVPFLIHQVAATGSRELLVIAGVTLAIGTVLLTSAFGISLALGAFLAGVVISETQENHAIFAETRPLRDLFVALFFVSLGFLVSPQIILANFWLIGGIALFVLVAKTLVVFLLSLFLGYHGKTAVATSLGLSQIGEFSFVIFSSAAVLGLLDRETASIAIAAMLITLLVTPLLFKSAVPFWRRIKMLGFRWPKVYQALVGQDRHPVRVDKKLENHIIIVGFGRVGSWVGKALASLKLPFIVIDLNLQVINRAKAAGLTAIYGDPTEPEVLEKAKLRKAKAAVVAIPDRLAQEELIAHIQTVAPKLKIISRAHFDWDWERLRALKVDKVVQPEFEAAVSIVRTILVSLGRSSEEIKARIKSLRQSHARIR